MPKCKGCNADILFIKTAKGKVTPVDAKEITIYVTGTQSIVRGHQPHSETCSKLATSIDIGVFDFRRSKNAKV